MSELGHLRARVWAVCIPIRSGIGAAPGVHQLRALPAVPAHSGSGKQAGGGECWQ